MEYARRRWCPVRLLRTSKRISWCNGLQQERVLTRNHQGLVGRLVLTSILTVITTFKHTSLAILVAVFWRRQSTVKKLDSNRWNVCKSKTLRHDEVLEARNAKIVYLSPHKSTGHCRRHSVTLLRRERRRQEGCSSKSP